MEECDALNVLPTLKHLAFPLRLLGSFASFDHRVSASCLRYGGVLLMRVSASFCVVVVCVCVLAKSLLTLVCLPSTKLA